MKRLVAVILSICLLATSSVAVASVPVSDKDPDGLWKSFIQIALITTMTSNDDKVSDLVFNDLFCTFMSFYIASQYEGGYVQIRSVDSGYTESIKEGKCSIQNAIDFLYMTGIFDSYSECRLDERYDLNPLIAYAMLLGGYGDVDPHDFLSAD